MKYVLLLTLFIVVGCTKPAESRRLLEAQGFQDIQITGYKFFSCSEDDTYQTGFIAKGRNGNTVSGTVCAGVFFKGATIRYD